MKRVGLAVMMFSLCLSAQTKKMVKPLPPDSFNSPAWNAWEVKMMALRKQEQQILSAEYTREKQAVCENPPDENSGRECVGRELALTQKNYAAYAKALSALLRVQQPDYDPIADLPPNVRGIKFDQAEREWLLYRNAMCRAVSDGSYGGNSQGEVEAGCQQDLTRNHMHELESLYKDE